LRRVVTATLDIDVDLPTRLALQIAVADRAATDVFESYRISLDGADLSWTELAAPHGGRIWLLDSPSGVLQITYQAEISHQHAPAEVELDDELTYLRPSRYCEADRIAGFAKQQFRHIDKPYDILTAVSSWVGTHLDYVSGGSRPTDSAVDTLLAGSGVCRDYAHLVVAILRALDIPARVVAVYAPGLAPMDFHAVAEALVDGAWYVVDASLLAPRQSMVRIASGRDAADTSFLSAYHGDATLRRVMVTASVDGDLPIEDVNTLVQLG
jgi:transglutaminase-like putative cysteine protease